MLTGDGLPNDWLLKVPLAWRDMKEILQNVMVLIIAGHRDVLIIEDDLVEDATEILGKTFVDAGHELPVSRSKEILGFISAFWEEIFSAPVS